MAGQLDIVINQIIIFAMLMAIGFIAVKANALTIKRPWGQESPPVLAVG